jgi:hypothetical protein
VLPAGLGERESLGRAIVDGLAGSAGHFVGESTLERETEAFITMRDGAWSLVAGANMYDIRMPLFGDVLEKPRVVIHLEMNTK